MKYVTWILAVLAAGALGGCGGGGEGDHGTALSPDGGGPDPFDENALTTYEITMADSDWNDMVRDPFTETWRRCTVVWQGETYPDVAVHPVGDRSRVAGNPKPSLRLKFDHFVPDREFHKYSSIKLDCMLNDHALMKARLEYAVFNERGVPAPKYAHCRVNVNGDYKGLYGVEERMSREFVRKRFGQPVNQLYEWIGANDLQWTGPEPSNYVPTMWLPKIDELPWEAESVRDFVNVLNNDVPNLPAHFDAESFLNYIAVETVLGEGDLYVAGFAGERTANIHLYRSPLSGRYMIVPFDADQGFWRPEHGITQWFENRILTRNVVLWNATNLERYKQILRELIAGPYATARMKARVDFIYNQIRQAAYEDRYKPRNNATFDSRVDEIRWYIETRNSAFQSQLQ